MAIDFSKIYITRDPIPLPSYRWNSTEGAVVDFHGVVRGMEGDSAIFGIEYEAYEAMAEGKLRQIAEEVSEKHGITEVILIHRIGLVRAGEASLFLRITSAHRAEAFAASREIIERLKQEVPIWKNPVTKAP